MPKVKTKKGVVHLPYTAEGYKMAEMMKKSAAKSKGKGKK